MLAVRLMKNTDPINWVARIYKASIKAKMNQAFLAVFLLFNAAVDR
jgi:hypothetical protein